MLAVVVATRGGGAARARARVASRGRPSAPCSIRRESSAPTLPPGVQLRPGRGAQSTRSGARRGSCCSPSTRRVAGARADAVARAVEQGGAGAWRIGVEVRDARRTPRAAARARTPRAARGQPARARARARARPRRERGPRRSGSASRCALRTARRSRRPSTRSSAESRALAALLAQDRPARRGVGRDRRVLDGGRGRVLAAWRGRRRGPASRAGWPPCSPATASCSRTRRALGVAPGAARTAAGGRVTAARRLHGAQPAAACARSCEPIWWARWRPGCSRSPLVLPAGSAAARRRARRRAWRVALPGGLRGRAALLSSRRRGSRGWSARRTSAWRPRPFRELVVTAEARRRGVAAAEVLAARVEGRLAYRGAIVTAEVPERGHARRRAPASPDDGRRRAARRRRRRGRSAGMHAAGVFHADLNLTNLLAPAGDPASTSRVLDFDRARLATRHRSAGAHGGATCAAGALARASSIPPAGWRRRTDVAAFHAAYARAVEAPCAS